MRWPRQLSIPVRLLLSTSAWSHGGPSAQPFPNSLIQSNSLMTLSTPVEGSLHAAGRDGPFSPALFARDKEN